MADAKLPKIISIPRFQAPRAAIIIVPNSEPAPETATISPKASGPRWYTSMMKMGIRPILKGIANRAVKSAMTRSTITS